MDPADTTFNPPSFTWTEWQKVIENLHSIFIQVNQIGTQVVPHSALPKLSTTLLIHHDTMVFSQTSFLARAHKFISQVWNYFQRSLGASVKLFSGIHPQTKGKGEQANQGPSWISAQNPASWNTPSIFGRYFRGFWTIDFFWMPKNSWALPTFTITSLKTTVVWQCPSLSSLLHQLHFPETLRQT